MASVFKMFLSFFQRLKVEVWAKNGWFEWECEDEEEDDGEDEDE